MRRSIALIASAGLALTLAACSDEGTETTSGETTAEQTDEGTTEDTGDAPAGGGNLVIWTDANREPAFQIAADNYEADTGNTVELVVKENDQMRSEFASQAGAGEGPDIRGLTSRPDVMAWSAVRRPGVTASASCACVDVRGCRPS